MVKASFFKKNNMEEMGKYATKTINANTKAVFINDHLEIAAACMIKSTVLGNDYLSLKRRT